MTGAHLAVLIVFGVIRFTLYLLLGHLAFGQNFWRALAFAVTLNAIHSIGEMPK